MMIVSDKGTQLAERLLFDVGRGVTVIKGEGGYSHREKTVLFCVVSRYELAGIKEIIRETDPQAFVCINQTYEIMGRFHRRDYKEPLFSAESHADFTSAAENTDD